MHEAIGNLSSLFDTEMGYNTMQLRVSPGNLQQCYKQLIKHFGHDRDGLIVLYFGGGMKMTDWSFIKQQLL